MAHIVLGIGTSHSPHLSVPFDQWHQVFGGDRRNEALHFRGHVYTYEELERARGPEGIAARELGQEHWLEKHVRCEAAIDTLSQTLHDAAPDAVIIVGDDQREMFLDDGMPAISVFWGASVERIPRDYTNASPMIRAAAWANHGLTRENYPCVPELGEHIIREAIAAGFDLTQFTRQPAGRGIGHAFNFVRTRLMKDRVVPMIPITLNTYYPPNQPRPARCYAFGRTLRRAVESWESDGRIAIVASGGLSHFVVDEELDRRVLDALAERDEEALISIPVEELESGSSEIRNWITVAGAVDHLQMNLVDYVPLQRTPAGTGCGMAFARWT